MNILGLWPVPAAGEHQMTVAHNFGCKCVKHDRSMLNTDSK